MDDQNNASDDNQMNVNDLGTPPEDSNDTASTSSNQDSGNPSSSLMDIKKQAISQLTPLIKHLDQSPEEHFKTILMLLQVSDNQDLIVDAYEAAEKITDEKAKAEALLDIVNEINYFTQS